MTSIMPHSRLSRRAVLRGGALTVGFALAGVPGDLFAQSSGDTSRVLDPKEVDAFLAVNSDGTVTIFSGKVDLGQGLRIAIPQIAAEELDVAFQHVVQQAHGNADWVHPHLGEDESDLDGVDEVGLPGGTGLSLVLDGGEDVGLP